MRAYVGPVSRRRFLVGVAATAGGAILAACGGSSAPTDTPKPASPTTIRPTAAPSATAASAAAGPTGTPTTMPPTVTVASPAPSGTTAPVAAGASVASQIDTTNIK